MRLIDMEIVIFVGLQASGKTTFFQTYFADTHALVSKDRLRNNKNRDRRQQQLIEAALSSGQSVVVDNTNPTLADRASLIQLGQAHQAQIVGYFFTTNVQAAWERNQQRTGKARVPDIGLYATVKKLVRPSYSEGFHQLFEVEIVTGNLFEVRQLQDLEVLSEK
jgi:predicted kinase